MYKLFFGLLVLIGSLLLATGCTKRYKRTVKVCDGNLFVEIYNFNPAGVDADYLTDSTSFRLYVGQFDNEHENFRYTCNGDTVTIQKIEYVYQKNKSSRVLSTRRLSISEIKKNKSFDF